MKIRIIFALLLTLPGMVVLSKNLPQKLDKAAFYDAMSSGNLVVINKELDIIAASSFNEKDGYEGALLMRKAGLLGRPAEKLKFFKAGRIKFETAFLNDTNNVEFHFLRFAIQEHAPKIVKYRTDLEADKQIILKAYKNLPPVVQNAIMDYTKNSKLLHAQDL
ncbi:hypothetical protein [Mucilaginibacter sp.]|uniref:hypothetical protein n=1 Tax=Mucilaginibacter sp. TaxID=1882438 RepID=UPI002608AD8C|nr:hypothetical protein [Mucilaginibacter sp.]